MELLSKISGGEHRSDPLFSSIQYPIHNLKTLKCFLGQGVTCSFITPKNNNATLIHVVFTANATTVLSRYQQAEGFQKCMSSAVTLIKTIYLLRRNPYVIMVDFVVDGDDDLFT